MMGDSLKYPLRRAVSGLCLILSAGLAAVAAFGDGPATRASTDPTTAVTGPTAPLLKVQMWTVLVVDGANGQVNTDGLVHSVLPEFANDKRFDDVAAPPVVDTGPRFNRRWIFVNGRAVPAIDTPTATAGTAATPTTAPAPLTVVRFNGSFDGKFDLSLKATGSNFFGHWPPAEVRADELLWRDLQVATTFPTGPTTAPADSVFGTLRSAGSGYVSMAHAAGQSTNGPVTERFLAVDLSMTLPSPPQVKVGPDGSLGVTNTGRGTVHRLTFYRANRSTVEVADVGDLALPTTQQTTTQPTTRATLTTRPVAIETDWADAAVAAGLDPVDAKWAGSTAGRYAEDEGRLTAVYRLDDAEAAKMFPIEVVPTPQSVDRFVLVVVRNVDPSAKTVIDSLIQKLGDDSWPVRDAAMHALAGYGPAAVNKLQGATSDKDVEIAWRAQRLMLMAHKQ